MITGMLISKPTLSRLWHQETEGGDGSFAVYRLKGKDFFYPLKHALKFELCNPR